MRSSAWTARLARSQAGSAIARVSASRYAALELAYTEPVAPAEPIVAYRTRAKLIVAPGGKVGLYAKGGGHQVVDIPRCRVLSPALASVAASVRTLVDRSALIASAVADGRLAVVGANYDLANGRVDPSVVVGRL